MPEQNTIENSGLNFEEPQSQFQALFEYATEGIIVTDRSGKIILANPAAKRLFGYRQNEMEGNPVEILIPTRANDRHQRQRENYHNNSHSRSMGSGLDLFARRKDGTEFPVEVSLSPFKSGGETFVIAFVIDVSLRKQYEKSLLEQSEKLERLVEERTQQLEEAKNEVSAALEKEKELGKMKSYFVSMASHEFRTPLTTINSSASLIGMYSDKNDCESVKRHANRIKSAVSNLNNILGDFLSLSKLEEGKITARAKTINLRKEVEETYIELKNILKTGQEIELKHEGEELVVLDSSILKNVLINLISNASKYSPENSQIRVSSDVGESFVLLQVKDQGIGISEEDQKKLFDRFYRASNAGNVQGSGLGLYIVKRYVELMEGEIGCDSKLGEGSVFWVKFKKISEN